MNRIALSGSGVLFTVFRINSDEIMTLAPIIPILEEINLSGDKNMDEKGYRAVM